jgi:hypothetical protein
MEHHPHLHYFEKQKNWRYLILGTFPPNTSLRNPEKLYLDYFYGNKGFLWKIIHDIYSSKGYSFFSSDKTKNLQEILRWQKDYCVALSDTIISCKRKTPQSSYDSDLVDIVYNHALKQVIFDNINVINKIIFTSSYGKNSAFENFKIIMGTDIEKIRSKLVTGLPSPSGSANITFFNTNTEETLGLTRDFYEYVLQQQPHMIPAFEKRWHQKKYKNTLAADKRKTVLIDATPQGLVKAYKLFRYSEALPGKKCG